MMEFIKKNYKLILYSIPIISFALHFHVFNLDLVGIHVWRQTETQTVINNFYTDDFNIFNPHINDHADTDRIFRMEFPIMQWLFALCYKLFGPHIFISRILSFIIGLFSVYGMYYLCHNVFRDKTIAVLCAWCFNFSPVFYYYTLNPLPDNMALCCGIWCLGFFYSYINTGKTKYVVWSSLLLSLAISVKLPFILYGAFILAFLFVQMKRKEFATKQLLQIVLIFLLFALPAIAWYAAVIPGWNNGIVKGVFDIKQSANELLLIVCSTLTSIVPELLINYGSVLFFIAGFYFMFKYKIYRNKYFPLFLFTGICTILYFLFEMNMITTVHDYYLFPFLPLIFLLVAYGAFRLLSLKSKFFKILSLLCLAILPLTAFLRADSRWETKDPGFNPAYFIYKNELRNLTPKNAYCITGNDASHYILLYYIDRKGWDFDNNDLDDQKLTFYISKGAKYLFLDSHLDDKPEIKAHLEGKIFDKGTLRVYKLK